MDAEREMVGLKKAQFMMTKMGEEFPGFVNSLANFGFFVELDDYFIEGLVKLVVAHRRRLRLLRKRIPDQRPPPRQEVSPGRQRAR